LASRRFAEANPELLKTVLEELQKSDDWAKAHISEVAKQFAYVLNLDQNATEKILSRRAYGVLPIDQAVLDKQQLIADTFFGLQLIPSKIDVQLWTLKS